jgi:hypothetical protein
VFQIAPLLGLLAGAMSVADTIPYVRDILRSRTRPHRGTWFIWATLAVVVVLSQRADGASWSLIMVITDAVLTLLIFALSIRRGVGGLTRGEGVMIAIAGLGVAGWLIADEPLVATAGVIVADLTGAALMTPKTWRDPGSETLATFVFASVAGALAAGAVGALDASLLVYPVYFCLVNGALALLIVARRRVIARSSPRATAADPSDGAAPRPAATHPTGGAW